MSSRLNEAFLPKPVKVELPESNLNDTVADSLDVSLNLLEAAENDIWLKFGKNWGDAQGNTDYHSSTTLLGYDKAVAPHWRAGVFAGYSSTSFSDNTASYDLHAGKNLPWHVRPYVNAQLSRLWQNGYSEEGAGVRHAFAGAEPRLRYSYMGDAANTYDMRNAQDKTHFVLSIGGETQIAKGWSIGGDASFTRGRHDKDWSCAVTVKRMW